MPNPTRRGPAATFANCNGGSLIRKTSFASRSNRRRQRSSFADLTCRQPWPMDEGLGRKHVCRSAQNGLGDLKPCGSKPLCGSLGTISSSRCQTTRDMRTLHGEAQLQARILVFLRTSKSRARQSRSPTGGARRDRTDDLLLAKQALSQLSYGPSQSTKLTSAIAGMVGLGRFELPTSRLSSARSNQLSY